MAVYDPEKTDQNSFNGKTFNQDALRDKEASSTAASDQAGATQRDSEIRALQGAYNAPSAGKDNLPKGHPSRESGGDEDTVGKGYTGYTGARKGEKDPFKGMRVRANKKKGLLAAGVVGIGGGGIIGVFSILSGPAAVVQFSQMLQKAHFSNNENFGDDRSNKVLLYALLGATDRGRLGVVGNISADKFEKKLSADNGIKPLYTKQTGQHRGYLITDKEKASKVLAEMSDPENRSRVQKMLNMTSQQQKAAKIIKQRMNGGVEFSRAGDVNGTAGKQDLALSGGQQIPDNAQVINMRDASAQDRRVATRGFAKATSMNALASSIGSRLAFKRGKIGISPLANKTTNQLQEKLGDRASDRERRKATEEAKQGFLRERAERIKNGTRTILGIKAQSGADADGNPIETAEDAAANQGTADAIEEANKSPANIRSIARTAAGPVIVAGVLCAAKNMGDDQIDYKQKNIVMPAMRLGMDIVATGDQVRSNKNVDMLELQAISETLYDEETRTSALTTTAEVPPEASLKNAGDKSAFFDGIDKIPGLGSVCGAINFVSGLPVIKQIGEASSAVINGAASTVGVDLEKTYQGALAAVSGNSINTMGLVGGELGAVVNMGVRLAAGDSAASTGGAPLPASAVRALKQETTEDELRERNNASFAQRYLDPYESTSLVGSIVREAPMSTSQTVAAIASPLQSFGNLLKGFSSLLTGTTFAADDDKYGFPEIGFTLEEQMNPIFEDPYENAVYVEQGRGGISLNDLGEKYKICFGSKIIFSGDRVAIEPGETVNIFTDEYKNLCDPAKNNDPMFLRYRFYLADTMTAKSLACYYDDAEACTELGIGGAGAEPVDQEVVVGDANMKQTTKVDSKGEFITMPSKYSCTGRTTQIDSRIAPALAYMLTKYNMCADDGLSGTHKSHGAGLGVDIRPKANENSKEEWQKTVEAAARDMGWTGDGASDPKKSKKGCAPAYSGYGNCVGGYGDIPKWVRWIGYNGDLQHGDPWHVFGGNPNYAHIHIGWDTPNGDGASAGIISTPRASVYTFPAPVPDDLKDVL